MARSHQQTENKARRGAPANKASAPVVPEQPVTWNGPLNPDGSHGTIETLTVPAAEPTPAPLPEPAAPVDYSHLKPRTAGFPKAKET